MKMEYKLQMNMLKIIVK